MLFKFYVNYLGFAFVHLCKFHVLELYVSTGFSFIHCGSWLRHCATSLKVAGLNPNEVIGFFSGPHSSSCTVALGSTQPVIEMSNRNLPRGKGQPARTADNLTTICEPIV
jgi:hypothetical protein